MRTGFVLVFIVLSLLGCATDAVVDDIESEFVMPAEVVSVVDDARAAYESGDLAATREKYAQLVEDYPDNLDYRVEFASVLFRVGLIEESEAVYIGATELGGCTLDRNDSEAAELKDASPDWVRKRYCSISWNTLGVIADMDGEFSAAEGFYKASLSAFDRDVSVYNNYGYSLMMAHRYKEAEAIFLRGLKVDPYAKRVKHNLALAKAWQGQYAAALQVYSNLHRDPQAYNNIGYIALLNKDYAVAINLFEEAIRLSPSYYAKAGRNLQRAQSLALSLPKGV